MEMKTPRKALTSKQKDKAKQSSGHTEHRLRPRMTSDQQLSSSMSICSVFRRLGTWLKQNTLSSSLHHATVELKQSVRRNQYWLKKLMVIVLWVLLLWLLSTLHMGAPCFILAIVFWLATMCGGPSPSVLFNYLQDKEGN